MDNNTNNSGDSTGKSNISAPVISLPKGGGAIKGMGEKFQIDAFTGTGRFSVPVYTTPCRSFEPELSLDYNSGSGNGVFGMGFSVSIPYISRKTDKNIPLYDDSDIFIFQGADDLTVSLIKKDDTWVRDKKTISDGEVVWEVTKYRPRTEGLFAKIEHWYDPISGNCFWKTVSKENITSVYGQSENAKIVDSADKTRVFRWFLENSWDTKGNKILYRYKQENNDHVPDDVFNAGRDDTANVYIQSIKYGNFEYSEEGGRINEKYAFEVIFDYGEYNIDVKNPDPYTPVKTWDIRQDPFSIYRSGFEIRTYRLCNNILMFHHFEQELGNIPVLVRAMHLNYDQSKTASFLASVDEIGFRRDDKGSIKTEAKPSLEFIYSQFNPTQGEFKPLIVEDSSGIPGVLGQSQYLPVDLLGDGIPGFLYSDDNTTLYWRPEGEGVYRRFAANSSFPIERNIENGQYSLEDLDGNGKLDFVVNTPQRGGFYSSNNDGTWNPYRSFESYPFDLISHDKDTADLNGDGLAEVLIFEDKHIKYYPSLGEKGYGAPIRTEKEEHFPAAASNFEKEVVRFADLFGDGLVHRVRIRNGSVECWPNIGYGRFNKQVILANAPRFNGDLDAERLFLADLDGSGTADIIYIYPDRADIFLNMSGNSFSDPVSIPLPGIYDKLSRINFADVTGSGSAGLIFTSIKNGMCHQFFDFTKGAKPYLLTQVKNNLGAITNITYKSSTSYYFEDIKSGNAWKTKLPFPVQVVSKLESIDVVSCSRYVELYRYHDGYYDGLEKEFRGFGYVEHWDTEAFEEVSDAYDQMSDISSVLNEELYVAPIYTKSWYHTGAYIEAGVLSKQYAKEYYQEDSKAFRLPDSTFDAITGEIDAENNRQAWRALKGKLLRTEIYAVDKKQESVNPYTVCETNYRIVQYQPVQQGDYAVFFVHENESLTYAYERNPDDPRIHHSFTISVDDYGNVTNSCCVYYPRRHPSSAPVSGNPADQIYNEQLQLKATAQMGSFINITTDDCWLIGVISEKLSLELQGLDLQGEEYFTFDRIKMQFSEAMNHCLRYDEEFSQCNRQSRPFSWERYYYWNQQLGASLPLGDVSGLALLHHIEKAVFTPQLIDKVFGSRVSQEMLSGDGGYVLKEGYWWNGGLIQSYYKEGFYMPWKTEGSGSGITALEYDKYWFCPVKITQFITDVSANISTAVIDYQTLQPKQITDINKNISQVLFDPLGFVTAASIYKTIGGELKEGDIDLANYTSCDATFMEVLNNPHKFLQKATNYFFYDLHCWKVSGQPARSVSLSRETHVSQLDQGSESRVQIRIDYFDGFGRCVKAKVATDPDPNSSGARWIVSGKTIFNNKGKPALQYLPFFSSTPDYKDEGGNTSSTLIPPPTKTFYDPLLRIIKIDTPKGFFSKVEFSPWVEKQYDENDTVLDSVFYNDFMKKGISEQKFEEDALKKALPFYNTPKQKILDNTGKAFITVETDVIVDTAGNIEYKYLSTYSQLDMRNNLLSVTDPRLAKLATPVQNLVQIFDMGNSVLSSTSVDAGIRLNLNNNYGKPVHLWDGRGFHTATKYDNLQRTVEVRVTGDDGRGLVLDQVVELIVYGESQPDSEDKNIRGQIFRHNDQAGIEYFYAYDIHGKVIETGRQLRQDYKNEVDWNKSPPLEDEIFKTSFVYNALGMSVTGTTPDGGIQNRQYNLSGLLNRINVKFTDKPEQEPVSGQNFIDRVEYNANNQRLNIYRNTGTATGISCQQDIGANTGVLTQYTYESTTLRLLKIITTRYTDDGKGSIKADVLQNIDYTYDPVGNVTRIYDNSFAAVFHNQQVVEPLCDYTYNALYKLIQAKGRQHPGILADTHWHGFKESLFMPLNPTPNLNEEDKLENYSELYSYDESGNLIKTRHMAASASWTREVAVAPDSNRLASVGGKQVAYDAAGNMLNLEFLRDVKWNYRNNISQTDIILRAEENPDSDFYVYGSDGSRIRKVAERYVSSGIIEIEEKIYLGDFEIKRITRKTDESTAIILQRQSLHIIDDRKRIAITHYWLTDNFKRETDNPGERKFRCQYDNNLGSACLETDEKANIISYEEYFPYGETSLIAGNSRREVNLKEYRYSCKERDDSTGLYYYGARYYISWLGRWVSADPAGAVDGLNLYAFVGGNPLAFIDNKGNVKILIIGEGKSFEYAMKLAPKFPMETAPLALKNVIVTQYDVSDPQGPVEAWPENLQLYRHDPEARPGSKDFDVTNIRVWQTLVNERGADFDAIIFNNPHAGFGQHKFQALGLTKGMSVSKMQAETIWYGGTMDSFELLQEFDDEDGFSKSGSLTDYSDGTTYSFDELFQKTKYGSGYVAKRSIMGLNEFILSKFKWYGAQLLKAGGTLEVNIPGHTATKIEGMGFVQIGESWTTSPYSAEYTSELTDTKYHPSFHETFQRTGPPRPANISSMNRFVYTK